MNVKHHVARLELTVKSKKAQSNPGMSGDMTHWRVRVKCGRRSFALSYSMGSGHNGRKPTAEDLLETLIADAQSLETYNWDKDEYRRAYNATWNEFQATCHNVRQFRHLIGETEYERLRDGEWED